MLASREKRDRGARSEVGRIARSRPLLNAPRRVLRTTQSGIGVKAVIVDASHERAASFHEKLGFQRIKQNQGDEHGSDAPVRLVLSLKTIREIFPGEGAEPDEP
jgi:hypothetical protein